MTLSIYIAMGLAFSAGYGLCYLLARADMKLSNRLCSKAIARVKELEDVRDLYKVELHDYRMMAADHKAKHVCVEKKTEDEWPEVVG